VSQEGFSTYEDEANKFRIEIPQGKATAAATKSVDGKQSQQSCVQAGRSARAGPAASSPSRRSTLSKPPTRTVRIMYSTYSSQRHACKPRFSWRNSYTVFCVCQLSVSVAITGIGPDFTSLKSFGDVDAFAENLVRRRAAY
jgi:hypothetical protein